MHGARTIDARRAPPDIKADFHSVQFCERNSESEECQQAVDHYRLPAQTSFNRTPCVRLTPPDFFLAAHVAQYASRAFLPFQKDAWGINTRFKHWGLCACFQLRK